MSVHYMPRPNTAVTTDVLLLNGLEDVLSCPVSPLLVLLRDMFLCGLLMELQAPCTPSLCRFCACQQCPCICVLSFSLSLSGTLSHKRSQMWFRWKRTLFMGLVPRQELP